MLRLVRIEYLKLKSNKALWILLGLYFVAISATVIGLGAFFDYLTREGLDFRGINPSLFPIYDWEDIWHNLAYIAYYFSVFPAFLLIISICNEFSYKTHRQNIIDGLSRTEFFLSKLSFAAFLAITSALVLFVLGLTLGLARSESGLEAFGSTLVFIPGHALELFYTFLFAMLLALLIRRSGITIVVFLIYIFIEWIVGIYVGENHPTFRFLVPLDTMSSIVRVPFSKYILMETPDFISWQDVLKASAWGGVITFLIFLILKKKDF